MKRIIAMLLAAALCCAPAAAVETPDHPVAREVVDRLRCEGWPDTAIAGVLGNMMAEVGGQTLDLKPCIYGIYQKGYYGLCMWSLRYCAPVNGRDVQGQLDYLLETIGPNMRQFGGSLDTYLSIKDPGEAGRYFCRYYERGAGRAQRARNAAKALVWINGGATGATA